MFDFVFERASESLLGVVYLSLDECLRLNNKWVSSAHLILGLIASQNTEDDNLAGRALASMSVDAKSAAQEMKITYDSTLMQSLFLTIDHKASMLLQN